jgi:CheY-like chemotaxis protein
MKTFTIFVLDDDKPFCKLLLSLVEQRFFATQLEGYEIVLKTHYDMNNITEAVDWIKDNKPDLVLLDYMLGFELNACLDSLTILKEIIPYCNNIKMLTGLWSEDLRFKLIKEDLNKTNIGVIQKPFSTDDLLQIIKNVLKGKENV